MQAAPPFLLHRCEGQRPQNRQQSNAYNNTGTVDRGIAGEPWNKAMDRRMERRFEFEIQNGFGPDLLARVDEVFHGENLLQMILHAHLLVERGMTAQIAT
jgi:hypothetical protein